MNAINYPPEGLIGLLRKDYEHLTLWMLANNEECQWADFGKKPLEYSTSTISKYLSNEFLIKGYVEKIKRGHYRITPEGLKRFNEISRSHGKKKSLNYPPKIIRRRRNYEDWILWMVYNNSYCKWSDFLEEPLRINRHSLSKKMNYLKDRGYVSHDELSKEYRITRAGKLEYARMLENYDLDRQSILNEESKRIDEITEETLQFFRRYEIEDGELQFRFLSVCLSLDYERVRSMLTNQTDYHKILLFLSMNHPDQYPELLSLDEFANQYGIKRATLEYYVDEIVENKIYPTKFFKLTLPDGNNCYFQENETIEIVLRAITEKYITKSTYFNRLHNTSIDKSRIEAQILDEACGFFFNAKLKSALKKFIPEYIKYLAYKMEAEVEFKATYDKLDALIWQNMMEALQSRKIETKFINFEESIREIDLSINSDPENIELYLTKCAILKYHNRYEELVVLLEDMIELFPLLEIDLTMKKATVMKELGDITVGYDLIEELLDKYPKEHNLLIYKAYWLMYLDRRDDSLALMEDAIREDPNNGIYYDSYGEILMNYENYEIAVEQFEKAIDLSEKDWFTYQTHIKLGICHKELENYDKALHHLTKGKEMLKEIEIDDQDKQKWMVISDLFLNEIEAIE